MCWVKVTPRTSTAPALACHRSMLHRTPRIPSADGGSPGQTHVSALGWSWSAHMGKGLRPGAAPPALVHLEPTNEPNQGCISPDKIASMIIWALKLPHWTLSLTGEASISDIQLVFVERKARDNVEARLDAFITRVSRILQLIKLKLTFVLHNINTLEFSTCRHNKSRCHVLAAGGNAEASG